MTRSETNLPLVLVVDDNADSRHIYETYLLHLGFRVATARDGKEALAMIGELRPDVVVMDLNMPVLDGWAAARLLKADPELRQIPTIAVSGHAMKGADRIALAAGCDRYLMKPCLPADLAAVVRDVLQDRADGGVR